jgi:hypothetical protein
MKFFSEKKEDKSKLRQAWVLVYPNRINYQFYSNNYEPFRKHTAISGKKPGLYILKVQTDQDLWLNH